MMTIHLPASIDRRAAPGLATEISDALSKGTTLTLEASAVQQVGQIGLQLLLSASKSAAHREARLELAGASEALRASARTSGVAHILKLED